MDNKERPNPFQELYLTEAVTDPDLYWDLFSPEIITGEAKKLFRRGNVALVGSNGTGKTMLLRLFSPAVQAAYLRNDREVPIPSANRRFLSVGINFVLAGVDVLGRRRVVDDRQEDLSLWSVMFGDYLNYFLVRELLTTLEFLAGDEGQPLARFIKANVERDRLERFARWLASRECWFGALEGAGSFGELKSAMGARLFAYRAFSNWNTDALPADLQRAKTEVALPLIECRKGLESIGVIEAKVPFMVTLDQYDTLLARDYETPGGKSMSMGRALCRVVNAFLVTRKPEVSYKVGVRPYSWDREMRVFGSDARLELGRDYQKVDLDEFLSRKENRASWIFPEFARDVASRRMAWTFSGPAEKYSSWLPDGLVELSSDEELRRYCAGNEDRLLPQNVEWPGPWNELLEELYRQNKFHAKLAETFVRQHLGKNGSFPEPPASLAKGEWNRPWWQKERRDALLMQIASACSQRRIYAGWETLLTLSGYNITVFLSLCREIWDTNERLKSRGTSEAEKISADVQTEAIRAVAESWFTKLTDFPGGARRQNFIFRLGIGIRRALIEDKGLVYPGHNGFSLLAEEYESPNAARIRAFLDNARDFGALVASRHTTKERDRRIRKKWYMFPLLCVNFEIPAVRTKEPYYATLAEVSAWLSEKRPPILFRRPGERRRTAKAESKGTHSEQPTLFADFIRKSET
jgi:hypothetical protein